jgi:hypothetical protein
MSGQPGQPIGSCRQRSTARSVSFQGWIEPVELRAATGVGRGARGAVISDRDRAINGKVFRA